MAGSLTADQRDVIERRGVERARVVRTDGQADVNGGGHRDGVGAHELPDRPVSRAVGGESIALADELNPVWGGERRVSGAGASAAGNGAADVTDSARAGGDKNAGMLGVGRE